MFNIIEKNQKLVKGIMVVVTLSFVVWGIGGYLGMMGDDGYAAKVGSQKIYPQDVDRAMENNPGQNQDKVQVLYGLVNRQLLLNVINDNHMTVGVNELQDKIMQIPSFQTNGQFDPNKYKEFLSSRYLTAANFEKNMSEQILLEEYINLFKDSYFNSKLFQEKFAEILARVRQVGTYTIDGKGFYSKINITESQINDYYQQNISKFTLPAKAKLQYIEVSNEILANNIKPTESEIKAYLSSHAALANKQVDVSHILFSVPADSTAQEKEAIKAKALKVLAEVKTNPNSFALLAKKYSEDPGSRDKGGDLGFFGSGVMAKPFESVAFSLKKGEISNLVETQFGYHILKLNAVRGDSLNDKLDLASNAIKKQKASQELNQVLDKLNELTYNNSQSLAPASQKLNLAIQGSPWVTNGDTNGIFANPKVQSAIFNSELINKKLNSAVLDLGNGTYMVLRASEYQASTKQSLNQVRDQIVNSLKASIASSMAQQEGSHDLALVQAGKLNLSFSKPESANLLTPNPKIDSAMLKQIFSNQAKLPSYVGGLNANGSYIIYQIQSQNIDKSLISKNQAMLNQVQEQYAMMNLNAYVASLNSKYDVTFKLERIKSNPNN